ncbi:hypothetical protein SISNIDRAFT_549433 [Sistotremastrum niveocremeum HHB9708]|uniref:Uncharacterized protein n=1 Tax=Sistotremastrum niveocremeum HHB9708 TaxID=1314777 RepID=A0A164VL99_9AGAM|nr:hypothetical protein SISNIDRAFT_549433 [Sistotremastrum niveocremeum HHB9708]
MPSPSSTPPLTEDDTDSSPSPSRASPHPPSAYRASLSFISRPYAKNTSPLTDPPFSPSHSPVPRHRRVSSTLSAFAINENHPLHLVLVQPRILCTLLAHLPWLDFAALLNSSRDSRRLFRDPHATQVILDRFVPGYAFASAVNRSAELPLRVNMTDLSLLVLSQQVPLARYPTLALSVLSALLPSAEQEQACDELEQLCLAHSRFALLLRAQARHLPFHPSWLERPAIPSFISRMSLRELTFPPPLSYFGAQDPEDSGLGSSASSIIGGPRTSRSGSSSSPDSSIKEPSKRISIPKPKIRARRLSIFSKSTKSPLPAPQNAPPAMRYYSQSWRRALQHAVSDDEFEPPHRLRHGRSGSETVSSVTSLPSVRQEPSTSAPAFKGHHDLTSAIMRTRAPVLRVYVPSSSLNSHTLSTIERRLAEAGLWSHLMPGDVLCNLGYVPLEDSPVPEHATEWLIFTGNAIEPFRPSSLRNPLSCSIPSPFYYSHLTSDNPIFVAILPRCRHPRPPTMTFVHSSIPCPPSQEGQVRVKRYVWITYVNMDLRRCDRARFGEGWVGEWTLEAPGTPEGKFTLEQAMNGEAVNLVWEVVIERSGHGKLWLKLLSQPPPLHSMEHIASLP